MNPTFNEKLIAYLTLLSGLSVSAVAIYYSVAGLATIFAAAIVPIIIMGITLEIGKIVATIWLKLNWSSAPKLIRAYLISAVLLLMIITSTGIFGFLSKAHLDQSSSIGDVAAQVALLDEKILVQKENISNARKSLKQLDDVVDQTLLRSTSEFGADKSSLIRRSQQKERTILNKEIDQAQKIITQLQSERAPIASQLRKVELEVGPIKYIAAFFYGSTDQILLEKAVTWMIILIIVVFDPLALILLIASQISFQKIREKSIEIDKPFVPVQESINLNIKEEPTVVQNITSVVDNEPEEPSTITEYFASTINDSYAEPLEIAEYFSSITDEKVAREFSIRMSEIEQMTPWPFENWSDNERQLSFEFDTDYPDLAESNAIELPNDPTKLEIPNVTESLYVQNEEQAVSNLWTSTTNVNTEAISPQEYLKLSQENRDLEIAEMIRMVKEGRVQMADIPEELLTLIKARV